MASLIVHTPEMIKEYITKGYVDRLTLGTAWDNNARKSPNKEGLVDPFKGKRFTWKQLKEISDRLAYNLIELGIKRDDVLVSQQPNCVEHVIAHFACDNAGILFFGLRTALRETEMEHILKLGRATAIIIPWKFRDFDHYAMVHELKSRLPNLKHIIVTGEPVPLDAVSFEKLMYQPPKKKYPPDYFEKVRIQVDELADLMITTGTTGMPKIAAHSGANLSLLGKVGAERWKVTSDDVVLTLVPYWTGINVVHLTAAARVGAKSVVMEQFADPDPTPIFETIQRERVTMTISAPTVYYRMVEYPNINKYDLSSLRVATSSGGALSVELASKIEEKLKCQLTGQYGMMEGGFFSAHYLDDPLEWRLATVGRIVDGMEVKLIDEQGREVPRYEVGEILGRGAATYEGYYNDPERVKEAFDKYGYFHTGDLGKIDEHNNIVLVGRKKDIIIRGGQNVYPGEIESLLLTHPSVSNVAVVGMPDKEMGEKACAFVILKPGQQLTFAEMVSFLRTKKIASYKFPERLELIKAFPVVGEAKVNKRELQEMVAQKLKAEGKV